MRFLRGFVGRSEFSWLLAFILSTSGSGIYSAIPRTLALGMITASSLKLAIMQYAWSFEALVTVWPFCDVIWKGSGAPDLTPETARAERIPSIGI